MFSRYYSKCLDDMSAIRHTLHTLLSSTKGQQTFIRYNEELVVFSKLLQSTETAQILLRENIHSFCWPYWIGHKLVGLQSGTKIYSKWIWIDHSQYSYDKKIG